MYLDQKKKRGQVVKINKELWISYKGPSEKNNSCINVTKCDFHLNVTAPQAVATSQ